MLALLLLASATIYDPPRVLGLLGPEAQMIGWKLKAALDPFRILPQFSRIEKR
jgi:hypothetical protein